MIKHGALLPYMPVKLLHGQFVRAFQDQSRLASQVRLRLLAIRLETAGRTRASGHGRY